MQNANFKNCIESAALTVFNQLADPVSKRIDDDTRDTFKRTILTNLDVITEYWTLAGFEASKKKAYDVFTRTWYGYYPEKNFNDWIMALDPDLFDTLLINILGETYSMVFLIELLGRSFDHIDTSDRHHAEQQMHLLIDEVRSRFDV